MNGEIQDSNDMNDIINDLNNADSLYKPGIYDLLHIDTYLKPGMMISWYFQNQFDLYTKLDLNPRDHSQYRGIIIPKPGILGGMYRLSVEDCIVVIIRKPPMEENFTLVSWITLMRLLNSKGLIAIFEKEW
jgi:hypothetical protein